MGRWAPVLMTLLSDLFHGVPVVLMVVCLAVGNAKPTNNFSWSVPCPFLPLSLSLSACRMNAGLSCYSSSGCAAAVVSACVRLAGRNSISRAP